MLPQGLEDVSGYPRLFAELMSDPNWSLQDLRKLAGHNLLRVMREAERVGMELQQQRVTPNEEELPLTDLHHDDSCFYRFIRPTDNTD
ncbi:Dipeptidase 1-like 5 [Homarus americanus]|uniref:Dipeptidase n=2 Tax=Homarus americanus TaxID=6706 RepID=A0A8J5NGH0_HOMAM|nr:Dipeptidase 1-like 5 [Homarus americanus]